MAVAITVGDIVIRAIRVAAGPMPASILAVPRFIVAVQSQEAVQSHEVALLLEVGARVLRTVVALAADRSPSKGTACQVVIDARARSLGSQLCSCFTAP